MTQLTEKLLYEISYNVLIPYRGMLYENLKTAKAFLKIGMDCYGAEAVMNVAQYYGVYDLPTL